MKSTVFAMVAIAASAAMGITLSTTAFSAGGGSYGASDTSKSSSSSSSSSSGGYLYNLAVKANRSGDYTRAIGLLETVVETKPANADAWNELGFAYRNVSDYKSSASAYDKALTLEPDHLGALNYQGFMFLETERRADAQSNADRLKVLCGDCSEYQTLADALADS